MALPKKIPAIISNLKRIDNKIICVDLKPLKRVPNFRAGQFLHLSLDQYIPTREWPESRIFSIASAPEIRDEKISVIVSIQGVYTKRIFNECDIGKKIWLKFPYGNFSLSSSSDEIVFIAGGTGITPFLSMIESLFHTNDQTKINLYYGVQKKEHLVGEDIIMQYALKNDQFHSHISIEESIEAEYKHGKLDINSILEETDTKNSVYYLSGPKIMIDNFKHSMIKQSINIKRIITDDWE